MTVRDDSRRKPAMHVTIKDIAAELGVTHSTVSRALNDHPAISDAMKQRARDTAAKLGYIVNAGARTLKQASSNLIGLIVADLTNQLFVIMSQVLADRCEKAGYQLVLCVSRDDPAVELKHVRMLRQNRAMGIIMVPSPYVAPETARLLDGMPVVQLSRRHDAISAPIVAIDGARGVGKAMRHLIELGHRRIGYVGLPAYTSTGRALARGYTTALEEIGVAIDPLLLHQEAGSIDFGREATAKLLCLAERPTAIVYGTSIVTEGGMAAVRDAGISVPKDLSIVGFGDPGWFELMTPPLSTIALSLSDGAEAAITMLLAQIEARGTMEIAPLELEPELILRGTTAPLASASARTGPRIRQL